MSATPETDPPGPFVRHVSRVLARFDELLPFALFPLVASLLEFESVRRTLEHGGRGFSINLEFALPQPLSGLWTFAEPPQPPVARASDPWYAGSSDAAGRGESASAADSLGGSVVSLDVPFETASAAFGSVGIPIVATIALFAVVYAALLAVLEAIYLGGIDRRLRGERVSAGECVSRYAPRLFLYTIALFGAFLLFLPFLVLAPFLFLILFPAMIVLAYLFYAAPFLFVVADAPFLEAFRRSYVHAVAGGDYFWFALGHAVAAALVSLVVSLLVSSGGPFGLLLALLVAVPVALVLTAATVSFLQELIGRGEPVDGRAAAP